MPAYRVVLLFENVPDEEALKDAVWKMRQAGRDHAGVPMPTFEKSWVARKDSFGQPLQSIPVDSVQGSPAKVL